MSSNSIYPAETQKKVFYVYRITNTVLGKHYYGYRSPKKIWLSPEEDLGTYYFSSSTDKEFIKDQKRNPSHYRYKIIKVFDTVEEAIALEAKFHHKFRVASHESFYNRSEQTSTGFGVMGKVVVKDKDGKTTFVSKTDPQYLSGELIHHLKGSVIAKDKDGNVMRVSIDDSRYISGELIHIMKGTAVVKDKNGNVMQVSVDDPRYISGELVGVSKGKVVVKDKNGNRMSVLIDDPRYISGELVGVSKGQVVVKDEEGTKMRVSVDDPRYISGELVGHLTGRTLPEEHRKKIGIAQKGKVLSEITKQRVKENHADCKGENNSFFGKKHTEESRKKIGSRDYSKQSGENHYYKLKGISPQAKGTKWYNDGVKSYMLHPSDSRITEMGLFLGRITKT